MTEIKNFPFTSILGWSVTRYDTFALCKRMYFYQYYAKYDPRVPRSRIDRFRSLVTVPLEIGGIVHEVIAALLARLKATASDIDREKFFEFARKEIGKRLADEVFEEIAYGQVEHLEVDDLSPKVESCLDNLLSSQRFTWLVSDAMGSSGAWLIDPPGFGETRLADLKVYCKVDFLFPIGDELHIVDWKTGKADAAKHRKQLVGYATWACYHFDVSAEQVRPAIAYLHPEYREVEESFDAADLENFGVQVRAETQEMYEYCRDVPNNIPRDISEFPLVEDRRICANCKFRGLCYPGEYPVNL
jgi:hypothetical protein